MNKILLLGSKGQLGRSFCEILEEKKINFKEYDFPEFDIIDKIKVKSIISSENPDVIINCTGYTDVAKAEIQNNVAMQINGTSLMYLVELCNKSNIFLCHFSTDYVFDGNSKDAYKETDNPNPQNIYGLSKYVGENIVTNYCNKFVIIRTAALFGKNSFSSNTNIIEKFIEFGNKNIEFSAVIDEFTSPTFSDNLASQALKILENNLKGIYHATSEGYCNWYQLAEYLFSKLELDVKLKEAKSNEFTKNYKKPHFSVLENDRLKQKNMNIMLHWKEAVDKYLEKREGNN